MGREKFASRLLVTGFPANAVSRYEVLLLGSAGVIRHSKLARDRKSKSRRCCMTRVQKVLSKTKFKGSKPAKQPFCHTRKGFSSKQCLLPRIIETKHCQCVTLGVIKVLIQKGTGLRKLKQTFASHYRSRDSLNDALRDFLSLFPALCRFAAVMWCLSTMGQLPSSAF